MDKNLFLAKHLCDDPEIAELLYEKFKAPGELSDLQTEDKNSLVDAINEVAEGGGSGSSELITIVKDANLAYGDGSSMFEYNIPNSAFPTDFSTTPYRYNIIVEVHGKNEETGELFGYTANHFCYVAGPGDAFTALCHDIINEGISHDTMIVGGEEGYDVKYTGFYAPTDGQALPLEGSKVSIYLQKLG